MYSNDSTKVQITQEYCDKNGWKVFPVHTVEDNGICSCGENPCKDIGKHPITLNGVKDATRTPETLQRYFGGEYAIANIGLATGIESGVSVLDVDGEDGKKSLTELEERYGPLPTTVTQQTGSGVGKQFFFVHDSRWNSKKNVVKFLPGLDVRTNGGYTILPPSKHKSGNQYQWLLSPNDTPLSTAPDWLLALIPDREPESPTADTQKAPKAEPVAISEEIKELSLQDRCELYLEKTPPAISGQGGHPTTYNVCCRIIELFGELTDDELFTSLEDWNQRCDPPWSDKDLRRKISEARKKVGNVNGSREAAPHDTQAPSDAVKEPEIAPEVEPDGYPRLGQAAYHGLAGEVLRTLEPVTEADPAALLMTFLTGFGVTVGRSPYYLVEGTEHHAILFVALVGQSSRARKGTSMGRIAQIMKLCPVRCVDGLSSGEGLIHAVRDPDCQGSASKPQDKRIWATESEFASLLQMMKRESNPISAVLRKAWDSGTMEVLTKKDPIVATGAHVGLTAHITEHELSKTIGEKEYHNGFSNRVLWVCVARSKELPNGGSVDLSGLRTKFFDAVSRAKSIGAMTRSPEAESLWASVYGPLGIEKYGLWDAVTSRSHAQVVRLSMLYALLDGSSVIEVTHLQAALAVWQYCDSSAKRLFHDPDCLDEKILAIVRAKPGQMRSEVRNQFGHNNKMTAEFKKALQSLIQRGEIKVVTVRESRQADRLYPGQGIFSEIPVSQIPEGTEIESPAPVEIPKSQIPPNEVTPATMTELFDWKNTNGITFERRGGGDIWVITAQETKLTKEIEECIRRNQSDLSAFVVEVPKTESTKPVAPEKPLEPAISPDEEMSEDSKAFLQELMDMESGENR